MTVFEKIIARQIPATIVYEDDKVIAIRDINPQAPTHILIIPKKSVPRLNDATSEDALLLGHILLTASKIAKDLNLTNGYRLVINNGPDAGESVPHLHCHLLASRKMHWPPG